MKWLIQRFKTVGTIDDCEMKGIRIKSACRRSLIGDTAKLRARRILIPDVEFEGTLCIGSQTDFVHLLRNGIGRHKAFGFGALMLRPPRAA
jgi:CRISPR system Cascade subunit CasE